MRTDFGGGAGRSRLLGLALRSTVRPFLSTWSATSFLPWPYWAADHVGRLLARVPGTTFEQVRLPHCHGELVRTPNSDPTRVIVYFHGGAFLVGGRHLHHNLLSRIARESGATVLAVEYRQMPRHAVARSVEDCVDAYAWALDHGARAHAVTFMGDSAGGFLTFMAAEGAAERGLPMPEAIVALSPLLDFDLERTPVNRRGCYLFNPRAFRSFARMATRLNGRHLPRSPLDVDPRVLPRVLIQVSSAESLYPQALVMHDVLEDAGVEVELQVWDGQVHVFHAAHALPEAREALAEIVSFVGRGQRRARFQVA